MRDREIYYDARRDDGLATAKWREPTRSDRLPVHRSESPTGYSSAGCSPAEPASASPVTDIVVQSRSSAAIKCAAQLPCRDAVQVAPPRARRERECHLYFARRVTFLSCADNACKRDIEMTPLYKIEVTHPRVLGSREMRHGGVVDEQASKQEFNRLDVLLRVQSGRLRVSDRITA